MLAAGAGSAASLPGCRAPLPSWTRTGPQLAAAVFAEDSDAHVLLGDWRGELAAARAVAGGAPGKRLALPHAKLMIHQGSAGVRGAPSDVTIAAREIESTTRQMAEILSRHSGRTVAQVMDDIDRDRFMTSEEAVAYGLVDDVLEPLAVQAEQ